MGPIEHAWHHAHKINVNYGANLNLFDKIHKTYYYSAKYPDKLGLKNNDSLIKNLFFPFKQKITGGSSCP